MSDDEDKTPALSDTVSDVPPQKPQGPGFKWKWWMGGLIGLAGGAISMIHQVHDASRSRDPEAQAAQIEQLVLSKNPSLALVHRREPELSAEQHRRLVTLLRDHPEGLSSSQIVEWEKPENDRINRGAASASDSTVAAIFMAKLALLQKLQSAGPETCKAYVTLDVKALASLPENLRQDLRGADEAFYKAYDEGAGRPLPAVPAGDQADEILTRLQGSTGIQISEKDVTLMGGTGPAADVCDAMIRFTKLLVRSPAVVSAPVIRFMLLQ